MTQPTHSQFTLFKTRKFLPLFCTQFLGAFNDNIYKNALIILIAFYGAQQFSIDTNVLINLAAGLFILPFFLFSATAGQIADKYEKSLLIRRVKLAEIFIMLAGALAFWLENLFLLLSILFLLGTQAVFFGPVKYAILPQHLDESELLGGNAQVEMGTFVAILLGTIGGGLLASSHNMAFNMTIVLLIVAVAGYCASYFIPQANASCPELKINPNPLAETIHVIGMAKQNRTVFLSIIGISWFWLLGAAYLTQIPNYTKEILMGDSSVVTLLLSVFTVGVACGSLICEKLSGHKVEIGLVPFGALGLTIFGIDLFFSSPDMVENSVAAASASIAHTDLAHTQHFTDMLSSFARGKILLDFMLLGFFGGIYAVPLYALIQQRSEEQNRARIIAVNNILNALFMVVAALLGILLLSVAGLSLPEFFLVIALMNIAVFCFIFYQVPEFTTRFALWLERARLRGDNKK